MSDVSRYEDDLFEQLSKLPFPGVDESWEDMKKLLDEDSDRKAPPPYRRPALWGSVLGGLLIILLLWFFTFHKNGMGSGKKSNDIVNDKESKGTKEKGKTGSVGDTSTGNADSVVIIMPLKDKGVKQDTGITAADSSKLSTITNKPAGTNGKYGKTSAKNGVYSVKNHTANIGKTDRSSSTGDNSKVNDSEKNNLPGSNKNTALDNPKSITENTITGNNTNSPGQAKQSGDTISATPGTTVIPQSNIETAKNDSLNKTDGGKTVPVTNVPKDSSHISTKKARAWAEKKFHVTAGIAVQQPVRLDCNCVLPGNTYNNKPAVEDYIPSAYVRLHTGKKWFVQAEFKYAVPQYIKQQLYKANVQNQPLNYITTSYVLKKVYYTQLPLSLNYNILPNWSLGLGVMYSAFTKGISQQDVAKKLYGSANDSLISSKIITGRNDSVFNSISKNNFQGFVESEYRWKQFSIGARYATDLQPYMKYSDPYSRKPVAPKNNSLNIFIRFELFNSLKRKK